MKKISLIILLLFVTSCAHHPDVRPASSGLHSVMIESDNKQEGTRSAISQANSYCKQNRKHAVFDEEDDSRFKKGGMSEDEYNTMKGIGDTVKNIPIVGQWGGDVINKSLGKGYSIDMKFRCQ